MAEEKISQDGLETETSAAEKAGGRIFGSAGEGDEKINLDEEIEKNIRIRAMPRKLKISSEVIEKKTTIVGIVIMIAGLLVLASAIYLAYIFLINPQTKTKPSAKKIETPVVIKNTSTPAVVRATSTVATSTVATSTVATSTVATSTVATSTVATSTVATSTVATSTVATSTVATSTTGVVGAPTGAKIVSSLSVAEKSLFGADISKTDSDGDGFGDLAEVLNLYNPAGTGKITDNPYIGIYQNATDKYSVYYPKNWKTQNLENGASLIFTAADNSLIQIISEANINKQSIKDWYNVQFQDIPGIMPATDANIYSRDGWQGIFQQDKEIFYLADTAGNRLYTISYVPVADDDTGFYNVFLMMINSFTVQ